MLDMLEAADPECAVEAPAPAWHDALERDMRQGFAEAGLDGSYAALNRALGWP